MQTLRPLAFPAAALALAIGMSGCGGSTSSQPQLPTVGPARTYRLAGFEPAGPVPAGRPVTLAFTIRRPDGQPLTEYRRGAGPHTGVHLIVVRSDLSTIVHRHPPIGARGRISERLSFPGPGTYRLVVDAYPQLPGLQQNFQLFRTIHVSGAYRPRPVPPFRSPVTVDGYRLTLHGQAGLKALQAAFLTVGVTDPRGKPARFTPWYGALAHAIFFRRGSLDYFHTHVCAPGASGCTSFLGGTSVAGSSSRPGQLRVGVLVPVPGTWRLFLQAKVNGRVLTAPFTLEVQ
jgi:hypothetical protein